MSDGNESAPPTDEQIIMAIPSTDNSAISDSKSIQSQDQEEILSGVMSLNANEDDDEDESSGQSHEDKQNLPGDEVVEGSHDETIVDKLELSDDKVGENSHDQNTVDKHELGDDRVGDGSHDWADMDGQDLLDNKVELASHDCVDVDKHSVPDYGVMESSHDPLVGGRKIEIENLEDLRQCIEKIISEEEVEPVFDGTEIPELETLRSTSRLSLDPEAEEQGGSAWPERATALKNFVKEKSAVAVSSVLRRLSGKRDEDDGLPIDEVKSDNSASISSEEDESNSGGKLKDPQRTMERSTWNPLNYLKMGWDVDAHNTLEQEEGDSAQNVLQLPAMRGRVTLYTRLGCKECREIRFFLYQKRIRYVEINIDVYPSRKNEVEKLTESSTVPKVFFNEYPVGGLNELKSMDESGKLDEEINKLITEEPSHAAPLPPLSGEDDESCRGAVDELALVVKKMQESILVKDRFYKMRIFNKCFLGSDAVDFLSVDQHLSREDAIQFGQKLVRLHFFRHILERKPLYVVLNVYLLLLTRENLFEDGNHLYRFLDDDPVVSSQCYNIPRGIIDMKPKSISEIASRLRFLSLAIFEAYTSEDGRHIDYRNLHGSEEFARYMRVVEELHRVDMKDMSREEKLSFFINLYNMMAIHVILVVGYPTGPLERRKMLGDFKYVIGGCSYSLSAIHNGILRGNQRPPYNIAKPFVLKDRRSKEMAGNLRLLNPRHGFLENHVVLSYPEPLVHFALVSGTRSGPALRCYSPGDIDKELVEAARSFLRNGGLIVDPEAKVASVSKILKWYSVDFGKNETEVLKHAANYLESSKLEQILDLVADEQLKVVYQPYDWGLNC
ncbi:hypothetical protein Syun_004015 [Stephania yunnanensis]|uniref:DEP domain-containing protein n=1 Tax=Stephania yunnanensis TaxID=152371 RepID=A0AAP0L3M2_9MAGN